MSGLVKKKNGRVFKTVLGSVGHLNAMEVAKGKVRGDGGITGYPVEKCPKAAFPATIGGLLVCKPPPMGKGHHVKAELKK